jgi:small multidrug resistance family-3 protein
VTTNVVVFAIAAFFEIAGCFAFWVWVRRGATPFVLALGIASLVGFALALTRVDSAFAGRAYAAYGGIYIAASLAWLWVVEGSQDLMRPSCCSRSARSHARSTRRRALIAKASAATMRQDP